MPNLPPNFNPTHWEILTVPSPPESGKISEKIYFRVRHLPSGTYSKTISFAKKLINTPAGRGMFTQQINALIADVYSLKKIPQRPDQDAASLYKQQFEKTKPPPQVKRPLLLMGAPQKFTASMASRPDPGTFYQDPSGKQFVYDGAQWFPLYKNEQTPAYANGAVKPKPAQPPIKLPIVRRFNVDG